MPTPTRYLRLSPEQDLILRNLELSPLVNTKVRLRISIIRLNNNGWNAKKLAHHFNRNQQSIHNDLDRYEKQGLAGLSDGKTTGKPGKFTPEIISFLKAQLETERVWNSKLLCEAIEKEFSVSLQPDAVRVKLHSLGYTWKRARYSPGKTPDPDVIAVHKAELEVLKKGLWIKP